MFMKMMPRSQYTYLGIYGSSLINNATDDNNPLPCLVGTVMKLERERRLLLLPTLCGVGQTL
jgi:hypothetical protein